MEEQLDAVARAPEIRESEIEVDLCEAVFWDLKGGWGWGGGFGGGGLGYCFFLFFVFHVFFRFLGGNSTGDALGGGSL